MKKRNYLLSLGNTKLIFGQTFDENHQEIIKVFKKERPGELYIGIYISDHHILLGKAPELLFVNPSYVYRYHLKKFTPSKRSAPYPITELQTLEEATHINRIYRECRMVEQPPETMLKNHQNGIAHYFVAHNKKGRVIGTVTALDHYELFGDKKNGASLWQLAVGIGYRRKGVGKALVRQVIEHFANKGRTFVDLSVIFRNKKAMAFYRRIGFQRTQTFVVKRKNVINAPLYSK